MTDEKVLKVIKIYRQEFEKRGVGKIDYPHEELLPQSGESGSFALEHCHGMLDKMVEFVQEGRMEKVFRWLGFIQGVLWSHRIYTLEEMKNHNRPPK